MNNTRSLPTDKTGNSGNPGLPNPGSRLQVSSSALTFDRTELGDESFLTLRITPPHANTLIVVSIDDASLFQVAAGVERLAFKQALTFKPEPTGSYIHLRYTPERSGRHQSTMTIEAPATSETVSVSLTGRTIGVALPVGSLALPAASTPRATNALTRSILVGGILIGIGFAGYTYRCQIWPDNCSPFSSATTSTVQQESRVNEVAPDRPAAAETKAIREEPASEPMLKPVDRVVKARPLETTEANDRPVKAVIKRKPLTADVPAKAENRSKQLDNVPARNPEARTEKVTEITDRKTTTVAKPVAAQRTQPAPATPKPKPAAKPANTDESELERVLNRSSN